MRTLLSVAAGTTLLVLAGCADTSADTTSSTATGASTSTSTSTEIPAAINLERPDGFAAHDPHAGHDHDHDHDHGEHIGTPPGEGAVYYVKTDPEILDFGHVPPNDKPTATVKLVNTGDTTYTILSCKANCGCTTANCPTNKVLGPGESADVEVSVSTGSTAHRISKQVTFSIDGHAPVVLPVVAEVVSYVTVEPRVINKSQHPEGKLTVSSNDGLRFRVISADPPVINGLPSEPMPAHELVINWESFKELGSAYRQVDLQIDHPKTNKVQAIIRGDVPIARSPSGPDIGAQRPSNTELMVAIRAGDVEAVQLALDDVTDQAVRNEGLVAAARSGHTDVIDLLLEAGAQVNAADSRGRTALITAVRQRQPRATRHLIEKGADVNGPGGAEGTALAWAAGPLGDLGTVELLLGAGADVNVADANGFTPLMWAARYGDVDRVKTLLAAGAKADAKDQAGKTALDYARARRDAAGKAIPAALEPAD